MLSYSVRRSSITSFPRLYASLKIATKIAIPDFIKLPILNIMQEMRKHGLGPMPEPVRGTCSRETSAVGMTGRQDFWSHSYEEGHLRALVEDHHGLDTGVHVGEHSLKGPSFTMSNAEEWGRRCPASRWIWTWVEMGIFVNRFDVSEIHSLSLKTGPFSSPECWRQSSEVRILRICTWLVMGNMGERDG